MAKQRKRKNPTAGMDLDFLTRVAADLSITASVAGCSPDEKLLIAALIPHLITIVRKVPKSELASQVAKIYEDEPGYTGV